MSVEEDAADTPFANLFIEAVDSNPLFNEAAVMSFPASASGAIVANARFESATGGATLTSTLVFSSFAFESFSTNVAWLVTRNEAGEVIARRGLLVEVGQMAFLI